MMVERTVVRFLVLCGMLTLSLPPAEGYSTVVGRVPSCTDEQAATQETYFRDYPQDTERAACLLNYYAQRLGWPELQARREWLIRWVIKNHPNIRLDGHLERGLSVSTADKTIYSEIRELWLNQVSRFPDNGAVLSNAANTLGLTDRETAMNWLKHARELDPLDWRIPRYLGNLYAAAIIGISETGPDLLPRSVDSAEAQSAFAKLAYEEAGRDAAVATATAQQLHVWTNYPTYLKYKTLTQQDYDRLAEALLLRAADLDYPNPTKIATLRDFYRDQRYKPSGRIEPKVAVIEKSYEEVSQRLTNATFLQARVSRGAFPVRVKILIGPDGHVWSASAENPELGPIAVMAQSKAESLTFRPLREDGHPVQIWTIVSVMMDDLDFQAIHKISESQ
jgi:hypothetical protein